VLQYRGEIASLFLFVKKWELGELSPCRAIINYRFKHQNWQIGEDTMTTRRIFHAVMILVLVSAWLSAFTAQVSQVHAEPVNLFASPAGLTTDACTQANPCALQTAIDTADAGTTVYVAAGEYTPGSADQVALITKSIHLQGGWNGDSLNLASVVVDPDLYVSLLNGQYSQRVLKIVGGVSHITPQVDGFTIENGLVNTPDPDGSGFRGYGAGFYISQADAILSHNHIIGNQVAPWAGPNSPTGVGFGGGIYATDSSLTITQNAIANNTAGFPAGYGAGAGIYFNNSTGEISNNDIQSNQVGKFDPANPWGGGAGIVLNVSNFVVMNNMIHSNGTAGVLFPGAAILAGSGFSVIRDNIIYDNHGATVVYGQFSTDGDNGAIVSVNTSLFENNVIRDNDCASGSTAVVLSQPGDEMLVHNNIIADTCGVNGRNLAVWTNSPQSTNRLRIEHNTLVNADKALLTSGGHCHVSVLLNIFSNHAISGIEANDCAAASDFLVKKNLFYETTTPVLPVGLTNEAPVSGDPFFIDALHGDYRILSMSNARSSGLYSTYTPFDIEHQLRPNTASGSDIGADQFYFSSYIPWVKY
jgi:hypothetical protein